MMYLPVAVDPVKAILSTPGCQMRASPASFPYPGMIFTTPSGNPALTINSPILRAVNGVSSAGFKTTVHPAANAGAIFQANITIGKFQGIIYPQTPTGSFFV